MASKKKRLIDSRLYVIIDRGIIGNKSVLDIVGRIKNSGVDIIQFRDKISKKEAILKDAFFIHKLLLNTGTLFIINDYLDVAKLVGCDGIHLGQQDSSIEIARRLLGEDKIIGLSCHNLIQAQKAQDRQASYISIGPVFFTSTKPESKPVGVQLIKKIKNKIKIPFFVIGGINENNIDAILAYGVKRVAVCRALCKAQEPAKTIRTLRKKLES